MEVSELAADLRGVIGVDGDLAGLGAGIVDVEDELTMALSGSTGGTGDRGRMKGVTQEERATEKILKWGEFPEELTSGAGGLCTRHLYRCYNSGDNLVKTFLSKNVLAVLERSQSPL